LCKTIVVKLVFYVANRNEKTTDAETSKMYVSLFAVSSLK